MDKIKSKIKTILWALFGIFTIGGIVWLSATGSREQAPIANDLLTIVSDDYIKGAENAPVTLIEYLDFECEACGAYFPLVKQLEQDFPNDLKVVLRYFPLPGHKNGLTAALAVEAAARQGKYNEMHDLLFTEQKNWGERQAADPSIFEAYAQTLGLDMEKFKSDVTSPSVKDRVMRDSNSGRKLGVQGTPTFFLNGEKIQNPRGYEPFKALVQDTLEKSELPSNQ